MENNLKELQERFNYDRIHNWSIWSTITETIDADIKERHCCQKYKNLSDTYAQLVYALEWPEEADRKIFQNAQYNENGYKPIILRGIIIDNSVTETGNRRLHILSGKEESSFDIKALHHYRDFGYTVYSLFAYVLYKDIEYSCGDLEKLKPGTKVIIAVANLRIDPQHNKCLLANYVDIRIDDSSGYDCLNKNYCFYTLADYLEEYRVAADYVKELQQTESIRTQDNSNSSSGEGCYIATAVYGSYDCPEVWTLRRFRDKVLKQSYWGRTLVRLYYAVSPICVKWFGKMEWFQMFWKKRLDAFVARLQETGVENSSYMDRE